MATVMGTGSFNTLAPFMWRNPNNITPFTYRDGLTFLEILEKMRSFMSDELIPQLNAINEDVFKQLSDAVKKMEEADAERFDSFTALIQAYVNEINNRVGPAEVQHVLVNGDTTLAINPLWPNNHVIWYDFTQSENGGGTVKWSHSVQGTPDLYPEPGSTTTTLLMPNGDGTWNVLNAGRFAGVFVHPGSELNIAMSARDRIYNVLDYGAVGDGVTDNTLAVQAASEAACAAGGGVVLFPAGDYFWNVPVKVCSNITYRGEGATLSKNVSMTWMTLFTIQSQGRVGYGSGATNVRFEGFKVKGNFDTYTGVTFLAANHGSNITVENCEFIEAQFKGHIFDLGGCEDVFINNCRFYGQLNEPNYAYAECIQLDNSSRMGTSYTDDNGSFDGLACRRVALTNSKFLPLTKGNMTYHAPVAIGSHYGFEGQWQDTVLIEGNVFEPTYEDLSSFVRGTIHFMSARNVTIRNNRFKGSGRSHRVINVEPQNGGPKPVDANLSAPTVVTFPVKQMCDNFVIEGNVFENFSSGNNSNPLILMKGGYGARCDNWKVVRNAFINIGPGASSGNLGPNPVEASLVSNLTVENNSVINSRRLVSVSDGEDIFVLSNTTKSTSVAVCIYVATGNRVIVSRNILMDYIGGIKVDNTGQFSITDNRFRHENNLSYSSVAISNGSWHGICTGNDILSTVNQSSGFIVEGATTRTIIRTNIIRGMGDATKVSADSAPTIDGNMTT